jgi:hypothetical protein
MELGGDRRAARNFERPRRHRWRCAEESFCQSRVELATGTGPNLRSQRTAQLSFNAVRATEALAARNAPLARLPQPPSKGASHDHPPRNQNNNPCGGARAPSEHVGSRRRAQFSATCFGVGHSRPWLRTFDPRPAGVIAARSAACAAKTP